MMKLVRIKSKDTLLGGVILGLSKYFNIDVWVLRIAFVGLFFTPIPVALFYTVLWFLAPKQYSSEFQIENQ